MTVDQTIAYLTFVVVAAGTPGPANVLVVATGAQAVVFTVLFIAAATPTVGVWLVSGAAISRVLSSERESRAFNLIMGLLLAGSVVLVFV